MYLRFGWVLGQVGLVRTLLIVVLANAITFITALSLSAIATNTRVGVGGAYFIISRSLGLDIGGAIGVPLFLSQAFSVTLYAFGLAESLRIVWPAVPVPAAAFVITLAVGALALRGAGFALKTQLPIMALIGLSLFALGGGAFSGGEVARLWQGSTPGAGFWRGLRGLLPGGDRDHGGPQSLRRPRRTAHRHPPRHGAGDPGRVRGLPGGAGAPLHRRHPRTTAQRPAGLDPDLGPRSLADPAGAVGGDLLLGGRLDARRAAHPPGPGLRPAGPPEAGQNRRAQQGTGLRHGGHPGPRPRGDLSRRSEHRRRGGDHVLFDRLRHRQPGRGPRKPLGQPLLAAAHPGPLVAEPARRRRLLRGDGPDQPAGQYRRGGHRDRHLALDQAARAARALGGSLARCLRGGDSLGAAPARTAIP